MQFLGIIVLFLLPACIVSAYAESNLTFVRNMSNDIDVIPFERAVESEWHDSGVVYKPSRIISSHSPVVVRQCDPLAPKY